MITLFCAQNSLWRISLGLSVVLGLSLRAGAQVESPQTFTLDGKFYQSGSTNPLLDSAVGVRIQILNHDKTCLLYEEVQWAPLI